MNSIEAIERLSKISFCGPDSLDASIRRMKDQEAIDVAIASLRLQEPCVPMIGSASEPDGLNSYWYKCGNKSCGFPIEKGDKYCRHCGQAVKWQ